jgi:hypothetical protein
MGKKRLNKDIKNRKPNNDWILTPGGYRPKSLVHKSRKGHALHFKGEELFLRNKLTNKFVKIGKRHKGFDPDTVSPRWITDANWTNNSGNPIISFETTWTVQSEPTNNDGQLIYLFNGLENTVGNYGILQPVLQWGNSPDGGGAYWAIASWYVTQDGNATVSPALTRVNPGDILTGKMSLVQTNGNLYNYSCQFIGYPDSLLEIENIPELINCYQTLEAYENNVSNDYPANTQMTSMASIIILLDGNNIAPLGWNTEIGDANFGEHVSVVNNSANNGQVDICY